VNKKNIVLITVDCLGQNHIKNLNDTYKFFKENGIVFDNAFSTASWTPLSFKSIFQSIFPSMGNKSFKLSKVPTFVEILQKNGYHTIGVPQTPWLSESFGYNRGFDFFQNFDMDVGKNSIKKKFYYNVIKKSPLMWSLVYYFYLKNIVNNDRKLNYIVEKQLNEGTGQKPVFLWLHYMTLHDPHIPQQNQMMESIRLLYKYKKYILNDPSLEKVILKKDLEDYKNNYKDDINVLDNIITKLIKLVAKHLDLDETSIILTADHGQTFGEHGMFTHGVQLYDELINVPLMISNADRLKHKSKENISTLDIPTTILDIADISKEDHPIWYKGKSILSDEVREYVIAEEYKDRIKIDNEEIKNVKWNIDEMKIAIRNDEWKYINYPKKKNELFYVKKDKEEKNNLIDKFPEMVRYFRNKRSEHLKRVKNTDKMINLK